eukprot:7144931-Prymnesium_polylepis.1
MEHQHAPTPCPSPHSMPIIGIRSGHTSRNLASRSPLVDRAQLRISTPTWMHTCQGAHQSHPASLGSNRSPSVAQIAQRRLRGPSVGPLYIRLRLLAQARPVSRVRPARLRDSLARRVAGCGRGLLAQRGRLLRRRLVAEQCAHARSDAPLQLPSGHTRARAGGFA